MNALESANSLSPEMRRDFAVVVPAFNEAPVVPELIRALKAAFQRSSGTLLGAITGRAIYSGTLDFPAGQALFDQPEP